MNTEREKNREFRMWIIPIMMIGIVIGTYAEGVILSIIAIPFFLLEIWLCVKAIADEKDEEWVRYLLKREKSKQ